MVPVVRHAEALDVWQTANEIARVSGAAKSGKARARSSAAPPSPSPRWARWAGWSTPR
jgi:hypothetical protein